MTESTYRSVCLIGADGAGKTTVGDAVTGEVTYGDRAYEYWWCGWREFRSLPFRVVRSVLGRLVRERGTGEGGAQGDDHSEDTNRTSKWTGTFGTLLGLAFFPFVFLDHYVTTVPKAALLAVRDRPVVYDRYYYGLVTGFGAYYSFPDPVVRALLSLSVLYPSPDVVIYLDVDGESAYRRKDDVPSPEYVERRLARYDVAVDHTDARSVDATRSPEQVKRAVLEVIEGS